MLVTIPSIISDVNVNKEHDRRGTEWRGLLTKSGDLLLDFNDFKETSCARVSKIELMWFKVNDILTDILNTLYSINNSK